MNEVLSTAAAARILGVVPDTVRQLERKGEIPALRMEGGTRVFLRSDVERVAAEREARQNAKANRPQLEPIGAAS